MVLGARLGAAGDSSRRLTLRIVVDVTPLSLPRTGIGNYLRGMLVGLDEVAGPEDEIVAFAPAGLRGRRHIADALDGVGVERRIVALPGARVWRRAWSRAGAPPVERIVGSLDVFHFSDWMFPPQAGGIRATTIHDLVPLRFPEWVDRTTRRLHVSKYANARKSCDVIVVNSRFTADDVAEQLGVDENRIHVAHPALDPVFSAVGPRPSEREQYLLSVSTLEPRKNLARLVEAFELVRRERPELQLWVAGAGEAPPALRRPGVRLLGYVADQQLAALYRGAAAFAYPSLFEGFGMPVVEALASGTPTAVSSHPSLDEASGPAAFRADPDDAAALAGALELCLAADESRRRAGIEHARRFTRAACGEAVLSGYRSAL